jgi:5-methylcytosine-specific restriction endonuclease McrA
MSRWYRAYEGTVTDAKLGEAALIAEVSRSVSIAAWHAILESAACKNNSGSYETTPRRVAVILCEPPVRIEALFAAFKELGMVDEHGVSSWRKRQFQSDGSNERVKRYRENRKALGLPAQWQASKELRQAIYERDGNACVYCGTPDDLTLDHKTPEMYGGDHSPDNLQTACRRCNAQKRDLTHDEYVARLSGNNGVTLQQRPHKQKTETEELEASASCASGDALKPEHVVSVWNDEIARALGKPKVRKLTPERLARLRARIAGFTVAEFREVIANIMASPFLRGDTGWHGFSFDWFTKKANFVKILEGNYNG